MKLQYLIFLNNGLEKMQIHVYISGGGNAFIPNIVPYKNFQPVLLFALLFLLFHLLNMLANLREMHQFLLAGKP